MFPKQYFDYGSKSIFAYLTVVSFLLHLILVFSTSSISHLLKPEFDTSKYDAKNDEFLIEFELVPDEEKDKKEEYQKLEEVLKKFVEKMAEKKKQVFVDNSDQVTDEGPQVETDKIGEKGSIAKDMYPGEDSINDKPRLMDASELPANVSGELTIVEPQGVGLPVVPQEEVPPLIGEDMPVMDSNEMVQVEDEIQDEMFEDVKDTALPTVKSVAILKDADLVEDEAREQEVEEEGTDKMIETSEEHTVIESIPMEGAVEIIEGDEVSISDKGLDNVEKSIPLTDSQDDVMNTMLEQIEIVQEDSPVESKENEADVTMEGIAEAVKEYAKKAAESMNKIKELIERSESNSSNRSQSKQAVSEAQDNVPSSNNIPYFEDTISNAPVKGKESFNIKKHEYAPYYKHIRDRITRYWLIQYGTDASIRLVTTDYKPVIVKFKVLPSGKIDNVSIADSAGNELLSSKVKISIQNTILNRFPDYIDEGYINVKFNFYFF